MKHCKTVLAGCLVLSLSFGVGCSKKESERRGEKDGAPPAKDEASRVLLVHVVEENSDSFGKRLVDIGPIDAASSCALEGDQLVVPRAILEATDAETLAQAGVTVVPPGTRPSECGVWVVYDTRYVGVGRRGSERRVFCFAGLPAVVPLAQPPAGEVIEHDPAEAETAFMTAMLHVRARPADATALHVERSGGGLRVALGGKAIELSQGAEQELVSSARVARVREKGVNLDDIAFRDPLPEGEGEAVLPAKEHGEIRFETRIRVRYRGPVRRMER